MVRSDEYWMQSALRQAEKARREEETPIGAVIVLDGRIIGRGSNRREKRQDVTEHAEMVAIRQASRKLCSWRLVNCTLYVTLEPCLMCAGAIIQSRISRLVYGAADPKAGACGSVTNAFELRFNHQVTTLGGVLEEACSETLRVFFRERRAIDKAAGSRATRRGQAVCASLDRAAGRFSSRPKPK